MQNTSYIALSRQMTMARELELVANNIANAETTAYRGERMMFTDFLHDPDNAPRPISPGTSPWSAIWRRAGRSRPGRRSTS
ncbi:flagellar basal body protein [Tistrella bauzanensis]